MFDYEKGTVQNATNDFFIRHPCCVHIAYLSIEDMFIHTTKYYYKDKNIHKLLQSLNPHNLKKSGFQYIQTILWNSLYNYVEYIFKNDELKRHPKSKISTIVLR